MEYPLLAPVDRCVMKCLAVDKATARVRDDGFRITQTGKMLQVDMVAIIPPAQALAAQELWKLLGAMMHTRNELWLFQPGGLIPSSRLRPSTAHFLMRAEGPEND